MIASPVRPRLSFPAVRRPGGRERRKDEPESRNRATPGHDRHTSQPLVRAPESPVEEVARFRHAAPRKGYAPIGGPAGDKTTPVHLPEVGADQPAAETRTPETGPSRATSGTNCCGDGSGRRSRRASGTSPRPAWPRHTNGPRSSPGTSATRSPNATTTRRWQAPDEETPARMTGSRYASAPLI